HGALCAAERHVDERAFVRHESSECRDLVFVNLRCESNPAFCWKTMHAVLRAPSIDYFDCSVISLQWKLHSIDGIAGFDLRQKPRCKVEICRGFVEVFVDLREHRDVSCRHRFAGYMGHAHVRGINTSTGGR